MKKVMIALICLCVVVSASSQADRATPRETRGDIIDHDELRQALPGPSSSSFAPTGNRAVILFEDFEYGLPATWKVVDGNGDGATWNVGTCYIPGGLYPPDYGSAFAYYDDDGAGSSAPIGTEYLLSPRLDVAGIPSVTFQYGVGFYYWGYEEPMVQVRYLDSSTLIWGSWITLANYQFTDISDTETFELDVSLADSMQVQFLWYEWYQYWSWAVGIDNVLVEAPEAHDVGCTQVASPWEGTTFPAASAVIGRIENFGANTETFNTTADVYDTDGMVQIFTETKSTTLEPGDETLVNFGTANFALDKNYYTEIYTQLAADGNLANDTSTANSNTFIVTYGVVYQLDAQTPTGDNQLLGIEYDGNYFYVTGGGVGADPNYIYVLDEYGTLVWAVQQPYWSTGWGWRDLAYDGEYFYASVSSYVEKFGIDLMTGTLNYSGYFAGPQNPNRALAYDGKDDWFFTANFSSNCYKFDQTNPSIQNVFNPYAIYGAAYDTDYDEGGYVWWHSQNGPSPFGLQIERMNANTMAWTTPVFNFAPSMLSAGVAGGLCFYEDFYGADMLFALVQGTPVDAIVGLFIRWHVPLADATIDFQPYTLNLGSSGNWVKCYIELEEGFDVCDIDPYSINIDKIDGQWIGPVYGDGSAVIGDWDDDGIPDLETKISRADLIDAMSGIVIPPAIAELSVRGDVGDDDFGGVGTIRVINPQTKHDGYMGTGDIPVAFALSEICPNPFSSKTVISYALPTNSQVKINIYDVNGRAVKGLVNNVVGAGYHNVYWDGQDDSGRIVSSGVYFLKFEAADCNATRKLLFLR